MPTSKLASQSKRGPRESNSGAGQAFLRFYRPVYQFFGFEKGYNFPLYAITVGALFGFILARLQYLNIDGVFFKNAIPGETYWLRSGHRRIGIIIHLVGVLIGGLFVVIQFTPAVRHKYILVHRISGYFAITLFLLGNAGVFMILDHSVGGLPAMRVYFVALGIATSLGLIYAYLNIKRIRIDQHRAWMIRTWAWAANIISLRLVLLASVHVVDVYNVQMYTPIRCAEIFYMYSTLAGIPDAQNPTGKIYPTCGVDAVTSHVEVAVSSIGVGPESIAAKFRPLFLMASWLALAIHVFLAELYLWLTLSESRRLKEVSHNRQVERGWRKNDAEQFRP